MTSFLLSVLFALFLFAAVGCGGGSTAADAAIQIATVGGQPEDLAMASDLQRYFKRNAAGRAWYSEAESISVVDGVITVETTLDLSEPSGRADAAEICVFIQGADVADFTPGHTVRGQGGSVVCPCRRPVGSAPAPDDGSNSDEVCRLD